MRATYTARDKLTRHGQNERKLALQRKNALFAGHDAGAQNWAMLASLIETCELNKIEPHSYLSGVLTAIVNGYKKRTSTSCYHGTLKAEATLTADIAKSEYHMAEVWVFGKTTPCDQSAVFTVSNTAASRVSALALFFASI
ncbi:hypothetical protein ROBYS_42830 [Roseobacter sp. OBYS 0001]|nr:hypothetical protein ROBYS_42830 [Roseobacter sp. OBYS 0001]